MGRILIVLIFLFAQVVASAQIAERICPETEAANNEKEYQRISSLVKAKCASPWYDTYRVRASKYWEGIKAPLTLDFDYAASRVVRYGLSPDTYDMLTFDKLDEVLAECYPHNPARRMFFKHSLILEDGYTVLGTATVAVVGYVSFKYVGGKLKSAGWLPLTSAATKLSVNPRWLKTFVYGAGILGASYAYQFYNQVGETDGATRIDEVAGDIESATRIAQNTGTFIEEVQLTKLLETCEEAINDSYASPHDTLILDNRDYICRGYVQRAQEVIAQMTEKIDSCTKELADLERARKRVTEQLTNSVLLYRLDTVL